MIAALDQADALRPADTPIDLAGTEDPVDAEALYVAVKGVTDLLKGDLATVLVVTIPAEADGDNDVKTLRHVGAVLLGPLVDPDSRTWLPALGVTALVALFWHLGRTRGAGGWRGVVHGVLAPRLWVHRSSRLDLQIVVARQLVRAMGTTTGLGLTFVFATGLVRTLDRWNRGPGRPGGAAAAAVGGLHPAAVRRLGPVPVRAPPVDAHRPAAVGVPPGPPLGRGPDSPHLSPGPPRRERAVRAPRDPGRRGDGGPRVLGLARGGGRVDGVRGPRGRAGVERGDREPATATSGCGSARRSRAGCCHRPNTSCTTLQTCTA